MLVSFYSSSMTDMLQWVFRFDTNDHISPLSCRIEMIGCQEPEHRRLVRYVKLWVAHALGMPGHFPRHRFQRKPLVGDLGMHHGKWFMSGSLTRGGGENVPGISCVCPNHNFTNLIRGPSAVMALTYFSRTIPLGVQNDVYLDGSCEMGRNNIYPCNKKSYNIYMCYFLLNILYENILITSLLYLR